MNNTLSDNIRQIRVRQGLTIRDFAKELGVSAGVIANLEYGTLKNPEKKMPLFRLISEKFGVPLEWILSDNPEPLPPLGEAGRQAMTYGQMAADPVVQSFTEFWAARTETEKKALLKAMDDFIEILRRNQQE